MRRFALDSNILLYAKLEPDSGKGQRAAVLFSEDFQHRIEIAGLRIVNPFAIRDWTDLAALLDP